jgi:4,5-dihydroxyphthalate decarboxylase
MGPEFRCGPAGRNHAVKIQGHGAAAELINALLSKDRLCAAQQSIDNSRYPQVIRREAMDNDSTVLTVRTLLGDYPNTLALKRGEVCSPDLVFDFADVKVPNTAFKDVVRHLKYDVAELAIVTYLQAKAYGKPLVLLPAVVVGTLPHPFLVYNSERGRITPADLKGRRVGIRAYSVTTAAWIRGILENDHSVDLDSIRWVTFEDPHVAEYHDPATAERAPVGKQLVKMLLDGEIDAGVVGASDLSDPRLRSLQIPTRKHEPGAG